MIQGRLMDRTFGDTRIPGISRLVSDRGKEVVVVVVVAAEEDAAFFGTPNKLCGHKKRDPRKRNNYSWQQEVQQDIEENTRSIAVDKRFT